MTRDGKPQGFFYLDHRTVDGKHAIITDTHVTPGNVHDSHPFLARLDRHTHIYECIGSLSAVRQNDKTPSKRMGFVSSLNSSSKGLFLFGLEGEQKIR